MKHSKTELDICPKCGGQLGPVIKTRTGRRLQRCSNGSWNPQVREVEGCDFVKWINATSEKLDEICPVCGQHLVLLTTKGGKKLKKCSTAGWDKDKKVPTGCTYVEWINE